MLDSNGKQSVAVRLALGETQFVSQMREFLEESGVHLDAFNQVPFFSLLHQWKISVGLFEYRITFMSQTISELVHNIHFNKTSLLYMSLYYFCKYSIYCMCFV